MKISGFFQQTIVFEGGMAVIALFLSFLIGLNLWNGTEMTGKTLGQIAVTTLPLILFYFVLNLLPLESIRNIDRIVRDLFRKEMQHTAIWQLAIISALAGLGEELLFRGLLQTGLLLWLGNNLITTSLIVFLVSLLFGTAHAITKMYFFLTVLVSVYFGVIQILLGNILVPIAVHTLYDFFVFLYIKWTN